MRKDDEPLIPKPTLEGPVDPILRRECKLLEILLDDAGLEKLRARTPRGLCRTVVLPVRWYSPAPTKEHLLLAPVRLDNVVVTQLFRQECELSGGVRSAHAIAAMRKPDRLEKYDLGDMAIVLVTKWVTVASKPFMIFLFATVRSSGIPELQLGFRIYPDGDTISKESTPSDVFMRVLARYGLPVSIGDQQGLFLVRTRVNIPMEEMPLKVHPQPKEHYLASAIFRSTSPSSTDVDWAFAISTSRYKADLTRHRH